MASQVFYQTSAPDCVTLIAAWVLPLGSDRERRQVRCHQARFRSVELDNLGDHHLQPWGAKRRQLQKAMHTELGA